MRAAMNPQNRRNASTPRSEPAAAAAAKSVSLRSKKTPRRGIKINTAASARTVAMTPASPKLRIRSDSEKSKAVKETAAVAWVKTQAGPTIKIAFFKASYLSWPASKRSRVAKVSCMLSEKLITMIHDEGWHHVEEHVEAEIQPAERAEREYNGDQRRTGRDDHERNAAEEENCDEAAGGESGYVVDQPIALDRIADLELHDWNAGKLCVETETREILAQCFANFADSAAQPVASDEGWVERENGQGELAVFRQKLAADDLIFHHAMDKCLVSRPFGQWVGKQ